MCLYPSLTPYTASSYHKKVSFREGCEENQDFPVRQRQLFDAVLLLLVLSICLSVPHCLAYERLARGLTLGKLVYLPMNNRGYVFDILLLSYETCLESGYKTHMIRINNSLGPLRSITPNALIRCTVGNFARSNSCPIGFSFPLKALWRLEIVPLPHCGLRSVAGGRVALGCSAMFSYPGLGVYAYRDMNYG